MIKSIGIDIVQNERIKESLNNRFISIILHPKEIKVYNQKKGRKQLEFICGRFCAKEAVIKCIGDTQNVFMNEMEIKNNDLGKPILIYKNYNILISISHEKKYTIAEAVLLK